MIGVWLITETIDTCTAIKPDVIIVTPQSTQMPTNRPSGEAFQEDLHQDCQLTVIKATVDGKNPS